MMFASQMMLQTSLQVMFVLRTSDVLALPKLWWRSDASHFIILHFNFYILHLKCHLDRSGEIFLFSI